MNNEVGVFLVTVWLMLYIVLWWVPYMCAQQNKNKKQIFWLTLFLGWFPLVWFILLIAALLGDKVDAPKAAASVALKTSAPKKRKKK